MGVIARQGLKYSIGSYLGILIGMANLLYVYPAFLKDDEIGVMKFIVAIATMVVPFSTLGANSISVRFYPRYKEQKTGFLSMLLLIPTVGYLLFLLLIFLLQGQLTSYTDKSEYALLILPLVLILSYHAVLSSYCTNFRRVALPNMINSILPKISIPILVGLYLWQGSIEIMYYGTVVTYLIMLVLLIMYVYQQGHFYLGKNFSFLTSATRKEMLTYAGYGILGRMSTVLATQLDIAMVASFLDFNKTGVYSIALLLANVVAVPQQSINGITAGILATAYQENNLENVKSIYYKSCLNQLIAALFIFIGIWASLDYLFDIMPNGEIYQDGKYVVFFIGLSKVMDAMTGVNTNVIGYSQYFRFNFYAILVMAVLNIMFNFVLIYYLGMLGAAISTCLSVGIFNIIKCIFIYKKFGYQPFNAKVGYVILIGILTYIITLLIPEMNNPWFNMIIRSLVVGVLFPSAILYFRISEDVNHFVEKWYRKYKPF